MDSDGFKAWLQTKGLSPRTINEYLWYLDKLGDEKISQNSIISFLQRHNNPVCRAFLNNYLLYRRSQGIDERIELPKVKGRKKVRLPNVLSISEINKVAAAMHTERDSLMVLIAFYGGLRISELIGIKPYDFNWRTWMAEPSKNGTLKVIGKGNKQRMVFIPQKIMARTYQWIRKVSSRQSKDENLFNIGIRRFQILLDKASVKGIGHHINPHSLRHSIGSNLLSQGWDLKEIADYLGHQSIVTTQIYTHITQTKIRDKFDEFIEKN